MNVELSDEAKRQFKKLPKDQQKKIVKKLRFLELFPFSGKLLSGDLGGRYSFRAWPYRIIYLINKKQKRVSIISIEHRQRVYK